MKKIKFLPLFLIICLCGCTKDVHDSGIYGFTERLSCPDAGFSVSAEGFINNREDKTLCRCFTSGDKDIILQFVYDDDGRLERGDFIFDSLGTDDTRELKFIKECVKAYFDSDEDTAAIFDTLNLDRALLKQTLKTKTAESGLCKLMLDVTAVGTVVTVYKSEK